MKKSKYIIPVFFLCMSLVGCGKNENTVNSVLTQVKTTFDTATTIKQDIAVNMDYVLETEEKQIPSTMSIDLTVESSKNIAFIKGDVVTAVDSNSNTYAIESYQVDNIGNVTTYFKEGNTWYKQDGVKQSTHGALEFLAYIAQNEQEFTMEETEESYIITGTIPADVLNASETLPDVDSDVQITAEVNSSTMQLTSLKMALNGLKESNEEIKSTIKSYDVTILFSYDAAEVVLSAEAKQAKEKTLSGPVVTDTNETDESEEDIVNIPDTTEEPEEEEPAVDNVSLSDNWSDFQFQFEETVYNIPISQKQMENMGYSLKDEDKIQIVKAGESLVLTAYKGDDMMLIRVRNDGEVEKTAYECVIVSVQFDDYDMSDAERAKILLNGQLTLNATYDEVVTVYGEPTESRDGKAFKSATYKDGDSYIGFQFDVDSLVITQVKIQK